MKKTIIDDLSDPLRHTADLLRSLGEQLLSLRRAASQLRASDQLNVTSRAAAALSPERPMVDMADFLGPQQEAVESLAESLSHAHAKIIEARAHVAIANRAAADVMKYTVERAAPVDPKTAS